MAQERQRYALQTIFSFFLGLLVAAFVGVGVNTFYPSPEQELGPALQTLNREMEDIQSVPGKVPAALTPEDQARLEQVRARQRALEDRIQAAMQIWARNTSIVIVLFATVVMALSLIRSEQLKVISNGLLLGGLFSMIYGTGWIIFAGESTGRFIVMVFALAVTLTLGYLKFVRGRPAPPVAAQAALTQAPTGAEASDLAARVAALEARTAAAASALSAYTEHPED